MPDPLAQFGLAAIALAVGFFIGTVGVGGVLLIPFLVLLGGASIHSAASTALFSFLFTGLLGTYLYQRRGTIRWRLAVPVCAGAIPCSYLGTRVAGLMPANVLTAVIAGLIVLAGLYVLRPARPGKNAKDSGQDPVGFAGLMAIGAASGFGAGFSGAGGPLFSVPIMIICGFAALVAVGVSQVLQILAALSGSAAAFFDGRIDLGLAAWVTVFELAGVILGVRTAHAVSGETLKRLAGALCVGVGGFLFTRAV